MKLTKEQSQEIKDQQSQQNKTKRVTVPEVEKILYEAIPVLDHGFIRVVILSLVNVPFSSLLSKEGINVSMV